MIRGFPVGEENGNPLQYSCLETPVDRGAWWAAVHRLAQSRPWLKWLSTHACIGEGNDNPLQCSCLENPRDRRAGWAAICGVTQSRTRLKRLSSSSNRWLSDKRILPANLGDTSSIPGLEKSPGEEKATHPSILAWRIPWTEEPGGLQSVRSQRVRHDWATEHLHTHTCTPYDKSFGY